MVVSCHNAHKIAEFFVHIFLKTTRTKFYALRADLKLHWANNLLLETKRACYELYLGHRT